MPKGWKTIDCSGGVAADKGKYILILVQNYTVGNNSVKSHSPYVLMGGEQFSVMVIFILLFFRSLACGI